MEWPSLYVFDACSLLNLIASRRFADIAGGTPAKFIVSEQASFEVQYVRRGGNGDDANEREAIDLRVLEEQGLLSVARLESPAELATFVDFAREMDDGEAAACALTVHRSGVLVTVGRKARRVFSQRFPASPLLTTAQVIKEWVDYASIEECQIARLLLDVEERARFRPNQSDPLGAWWNSIRSQF